MYVISCVQVKAGSLHALVDQLAPDNGAVDVAFVNEFLFSFRAFSNARELLSLLVSRWLYLPGSGGDRQLTSEERAIWRPVVQLRVISVLKRWLELHPSDFGNASDVEREAKRAAAHDAESDTASAKVRSRDRRQSADGDDETSGFVVAKELYRFITGTLAKDKTSSRWASTLLIIFFSRVNAAVVLSLLDWSLPLRAIAAVMRRRDCGLMRHTERLTESTVVLAGSRSKVRVALRNSQESVSREPRTAFCASEAIDWLVKHLDAAQRRTGGKSTDSGKTRERATELLQSMLDNEIVALVERTASRALADDDTLLRFSGHIAAKEDPVRKFDKKESLSHT